MDNYNAAVEEFISSMDFSSIEEPKGNIVLATSMPYFPPGRERRLTKPPKEDGCQTNRLEENSFRFTYGLEYFILSFGVSGIQLGRNHPDSDPERYANNGTDECGSNMTSDDEVRPYYLKHKSSCFDRYDKSNLVYNLLNPYVKLEEIGDFGVELLEELYRSQSDTELLEIFYLLVERMESERENQATEMADEWELVQKLLHLLDPGLDENLPDKKYIPHYPVGDWKFTKCDICLVLHWLYTRPCCQYPSCHNCLQEYFVSKVEQGIFKIECCNSACHSYIHRDEISITLPPATKETFHKLLSSAEINKFTKTCPRCSHVTRADIRDIKWKKASVKRIQCPMCQLEWCFKCHAPWHEKMSCKKFKKGNRLLKKWAKTVNEGQLNAQTCPKCKIYIQRIDGCDEMYCERCRTKFCYSCGDKFRKFLFFGNHRTKYSILGCKNIYKPDKPIERKIIRGAVFGGSLIVVPVLGTIAAAVAVGLSVIVLPLYGGYILYQRNKKYSISITDIIAT